MSTTAIRDRHGHTVEITLSDGDRALELTPAGLEAALKLRRRLLHQQRLYSAGIRKLFGFLPSRAQVALWNGAGFLLEAPRDKGTFICDLDGIILRDQYDIAGRPAGMTVIDAGANIGVFSLYAAALGAKRVYAFEAVTETFKMLERNLALSRAGTAVKAFNLALGEAEGRAELKFGTDGAGSAMIGGEDTVNAGVYYPARRQVRVAPLDSLVKGRVDFLKMDVEGYEARVLAGAGGLISRWKPVLSLAAYHRPSDRRTLRRAVSRLQPGYRARFNAFAEEDLCCEFGRGGSA